VLAVAISGLGGKLGVFLIAIVLLFTGLSYVGAVRRNYATRKSTVPHPPREVEPGHEPDDPRDHP
jgi:hypothetical protein